MIWLEQLDTPIGFIDCRQPIILEAIVAAAHINNLTRHALFRNRIFREMPPNY